MVNSTCLWSLPFLSASVFISLPLLLSHFFSLLAVLSMHLHISRYSVINLRLQLASPCLHAAALGEFAAQERSWRCKTKIFQKDLIGSRTVAEAPDAVRHKSDVRSNHYGAGNHMVSGVFRLYCPEEMRLGDAGRQLLAHLLKMNSQQACHFKQPFAFYWSSCVEELQMSLWRFSMHIFTSAGLNLSWSSLNWRDTWCTSMLQTVTGRKCWSAGMHSSRSRYQVRYINSHMIFIILYTVIKSDRANSEFCMPLLIIYGYTGVVKWRINSTP